MVAQLSMDAHDSSYLINMEIFYYKVFQLNTVLYVYIGYGKAGGLIQSMLNHKKDNLV